MATLEQLSAALVKADAAGNTEDAKALADAIRKMRAAAPEQPKAAPEQPSEIPTRRNTAQATGSLVPSMQTLGNIAAGVARGIGSIPSTVVGLFQKEGDTSIGQGIDERFAKMGVDTTSTSYRGGKVGGEILTTAPLGGLMAIPLRAAAPTVATALQTGGLAKTTAQGANIGLGTRIGAGATVGATAAGLTGEDATLGATIGGALPVAGAVIGKTVTKAADVFKPSRLKYGAVAEALNNDPVLLQQAKTLLEQGKTVDEVAVALNSSGLAKLFEQSKGASNVTRDLYNSIDAALLETQANKLAQAQRNVNALAQQNIPVATASPTAPRRAIKQALAGEAATLQGKKATLTGRLTAQQQAEEAALQARQTAMTGQLTAQQQAEEAALAIQRQDMQSDIASISQLELGRYLSKSALESLENTRETVIRPAYQKAFDAAPSPTINLSGLADVAKGQRQELLTQLKGLAPESAELLQRYGPREVESLVQGVPVKTTVPAKPITLEDAHALRQAINIDRAALKGSNESGANIARKRLNELYDSLNASIARDVPKEAKSLFDNANKLFKEQIVDVYRTGQPSNLTRTSTLNEPMLLPENVVSKVMDSEGNAIRFMEIFKKDPAAMLTVKKGVEDLYRQQVMSGGKAATPAAHAKFMYDNQKQLGTLDAYGLEMTDRLNEIGGQIKKLTAAEEALVAQGKAIPSKVSEAFKGKVEELAAQGKAIPGKVNEAFKAEDEALKLASSTLGFKQTDKLRTAVIKDPEVASQALKRMDAPAKSSLARGVMLDAGNTTDPLKHLIDNERGIMQVLRAHNPKTAQSVFNTAKETAELTKMIEQTGNKLGSVPPANAMVTQQNINNLTQGLPEVRAVVDDIQRQIKTKEGFEKLAAQGQANISKLFSEETKPHLFPLNQIWSIANMILSRVEGKLDKKLAIQLAQELATPETAAAAVSKAQAKAITQTQPSKIAQGVRKTVQTGAKGLVVVPESESNQNALAR
jgi:hypothetical protein